MDKLEKIYEEHLLNDKPLPFIFHLDVVGRGTGIDLRMNWHPNVEILYFIEGSGRVICDTQEYTVEKGDIFLINSNLGHCIMSNETVKYYCLIIDNEFCTANNIDCEETRFQELIKSDTVCTLYREVVREYSENSFYRNAGIKSAVLALMVHIARLYTEAAKDDGEEGKIRRHRDGIKPALRFIRSHWSEAITLEEIADRAGLSKYYFLREFRAATGYTPIAYINKLRCENAKKLLLSSNYSISEICEKTGFESLSYFSKKFKESEGCTPSQFVKRYTEI